RHRRHTGDRPRARRAAHRRGSPRGPGRRRGHAGARRARREGTRRAVRRGAVRPAARTRGLLLMARPLLLHGGRVHVGDGRSSEAVLMRDGMVAAIGPANELRRGATDAEMIDVRGGIVVPGWCDAHVHFMWWSFQMTQLDLRTMRTIDDTLGAIERHAAALRPDTWIVGGRFDKNLWGRWPTAAELDRVSGGRPAVLRSRDGHSRWLNTEALARAGIDASTTDPDGGRIEPHRSGAPTGVLMENATRIADAVIPPPT